MTLDLVTSQRLVDPTPWEMEQYRSAPKHERDDWHDVLDRASAYRWDDAVLRVVESEARREEHARRRWFMPAAAMCGGPRPNVFRALYQKDIGGVAGISDSWFDASYYVVDGVSGKVSDVVDYVDNTHTLRQSTSAVQTAVPASDVAFGGASVLAFSNNEFFVSTRNTSLWKYLSDGSGAEVFAVVSGSSGNIFASSNGSANPSFEINISSTNGVFLVRTAFASPIVNVNTSQNIANVATYLDASYTSTAYALRLKSAVRASGGATTPSPNNPAVPPALGALGAAAAKYTGKIRSLYAFRREVGAAHRTIVQQWIQRETGIAP